MYQCTVGFLAGPFSPRLVRYGTFCCLATGVVGGRWVEAQDLARDVSDGLACTVEALECTTERRSIWTRCKDRVKEVARSTYCARGGKGRGGRAGARERGEAGGGEGEGEVGG